MLSEHTISRVAAYWAAHLGCSTEALFAEPLHIVTHAIDLADYNGIFALFRDGAAMVSFPPDSVQALRDLLPPQPLTPVRFADAFSGSSFTVIGPAYIGYAEVVRAPSHRVRSLTECDASKAEALREACSLTEWEHGGSDVNAQPSSGVFAGSELAALAGYEVWGGVLAHISIITHPAFRSQGFGRSAVAHVAAIALANGLVPQYRTLESNRPSIRIAESLGFVHYASSVAVRLNRASQQIK
jgi:GNAT superfamily N-acetyltransferase